jgi:hypothetical protein
MCDWTGCLKPSEMTLTVTLIHDGRDGETKVARYCMDHADDWVTLHANDPKRKFKVHYDADKD